MYHDQKIVATIEARMTSSRLPGKVLFDLAGKPSLQHIIERLKRSKYIDDVVVATTGNYQDNPIIDLCHQINCNFFQGSEEDVLLRVLKAAESVNADIIVEVTGDCPVIDWRHADHLIELFFSGIYDYASNIIPRSFPDGFDLQVFRTSTLNEVNKLTQNPADHEHVSIYIYTHPERFKLVNWKAEGIMNNPELAITLDEKEDYELIKKIYEGLYFENEDFSAEDAVKFLLRNPEINKKVQAIKRKDAFEERNNWEMKK